MAGAPTVALVVFGDDDGKTRGMAAFASDRTTDFDVKGLDPSGLCEAGDGVYGLQHPSTGAAPDTTTVGESLTLVAADGGVRSWAKVFVNKLVFYGFEAPEPLEGNWTLRWGTTDEGGRLSLSLPSKVELPQAPTATDAVRWLGDQPLVLTVGGAPGQVIKVQFRSRRKAVAPITCSLPDTGTVTVPVSAMRLLTHEHDEVLVSRVGASRAGWVERFTQFVAVQGITTRNVVRPFELQRKRVFITAADFSGNLGGLEGADATCTEAAAAAGLGGTWLAWLSTPARSAKDRLTSDGPWYRPDRKTLVAASRAALTTSGLAARITHTETGATPRGTQAWTGTFEGGSVSPDTCRSWTSNSVLDVGTAGSTSESSSWSSAGAMPCAYPRHLYCFER